MNKFFSLIKISWRAIWSNKARTGLTVLGIVIGIASIITVFSAGQGVSDLLLSQVESFGTDIIETEIKAPSTKKGAAGDQESASSMVAGVQITTLKISDLEDINKISNIKDSYGALLSQDEISHESNIMKALIFGVSASYIDVDKSEIDYGRFFDKSEDDSLSQVAVLGYKAKERLFGDSDPIGQFISFKKKKFRVIGVMKERGAMMFMDFDKYVYIPVKTLQKKIMGIDYVTYMVHGLYDTSISEQTAEDIRWLLRENHDISDPAKDDFRVTTMDEMMSMLNVIMSAITILLLAIVFVALIVGGVGVTNVMYVVVLERTREIGLRKALGAKNSDILWQFLIESIFVTMLGGIIGIILGLGLSALVAFGAQQYGLDWNFVVPVRAYVVALFFSLFFGVIFGVFPSKKAARLHPIEALRYE